MFIDQVLLSSLVWLFPLLVTFLLWKQFTDFRSAKIFDISLLFFISGFALERLYFFLVNYKFIQTLGWALTFDSSFKPSVFFDLTTLQGFSFVVFLAGGLLGTLIYNSINTVSKIELKYLDKIIRFVLPMFFIAEAIMMLNWDFQNLSLYRLSVIFLLVIFLLSIGLMVLYNYKKSYFQKSQGTYSAMVLIVVSILVLVENYAIPSVDRVLFNIFNPEQIICIILLMIAVNILLTNASQNQERVYKRDEYKEKVPERGFAISFANKRRISNPLNSQFRKFVKTKNKIQRKSVK